MNSPDSTPPPAGDAPDWNAIARHLAGEATAEESAAVAAWLASHPDDARSLDLLARAASRLRAEAATDVDVEGALARTCGRMRETGTATVPLRPARRSARLPYFAWSLAAAAVVVIAVGVVRSREESPAAPARTVATSTGQLDSLRLADGTRVVLGPASAIDVDGAFGATRREVRLRGTAFFAVAHDARRPFTVRAGDAVITDIGTAFSVRADDADGVEVAVTEGVVRLQADDAAGVELSAGDRGTLQPSGALLVQRAGVSADDSAWTRGRLVFRETPLARVRTDLRRWFGVELVVADSALAQRHLTASFQHDSRRQVLDVIALALGATYTMRGDTALLRPGALTVRQRP